MTNRFNPLILDAVVASISGSSHSISVPGAASGTVEG